MHDDDAVCPDCGVECPEATAHELLVEARTLIEDAVMMLVSVGIHDDDIVRGTKIIIEAVHRGREVDAALAEAPRVN